MPRDQDLRVLDIVGLVKLSKLVNYRTIKEMLGMYKFILSWVLFSSVLAVAEKPYIFLFQKQKDPAAIKEAADTLSKRLSEKLHHSVLAQVPQDYGVSVQAIKHGTADVAYVDSMSFLLAEDSSEILLAEERPDANGVYRTEYDSLFIVPKNSPLNSLSDLKEKAKDLTIVFTSPTSTSGYIFPLMRLAKEGFDDPKKSFKQVAFGGSYAQALERVASGLGDVACVSFYAFEGSSPHVSDEIRSKLRVLARTGGVPTHVIVARKSLDEATKANIKDSILKLSEQSSELFSDVYGAARFKEVDPKQHIYASREAIKLSGLPIPGSK